MTPSRIAAMLTSHWFGNSLSIFAHNWKYNLFFVCFDMQHGCSHNITVYEFNYSIRYLQSEDYMKLHYLIKPDVKGNKRSMKWNISFYNIKFSSSIFILFKSYMNILKQCNNGGWNKINLDKEHHSVFNYNDG